MEFCITCYAVIGPAVKENTDQPDIMEIEKKNLGSLLALYPKPMTVVGTKVKEK